MVVDVMRMHKDLRIPLTKLCTTLDIEFPSQQVIEMVAAAKTAKDLRVVVSNYAQEAPDDVVQAARKHMNDLLEQEFNAMESPTAHDLRYMLSLADGCGPVVACIQAAYEARVQQDLERSNYGALVQVVGFGSRASQEVQSAAKTKLAPMLLEEISQAKSVGACLKIADRAHHLFFPDEGSEVKCAAYERALTLATKVSLALRVYGGIHIGRDIATSAYNKALELCTNKDETILVMEAAKDDESKATALRQVAQFYEAE